MRTSILAAAMLVPILGIAGVAAIALPAAAESHGSSSACAPADTAGPATLNLDAIPVQPVNGRLAVTGAHGDDDDCGLDDDHHHGRDGRMGDDD